VRPDGDRPEDTTDPWPSQESLDKKAQCTYRCVVLPDAFGLVNSARIDMSLNAPTGAWCSLTRLNALLTSIGAESQCTYRCVVLPDISNGVQLSEREMSQCTYRCVVLPDVGRFALYVGGTMSQCTYRCVVLPDRLSEPGIAESGTVSMHLQVRGAP